MTLEEPTLERGYIAGDLRDEFPELALVYTRVDVPVRRSPDALRARLRQASDRFTGPRAIALRQQPIPWAYRVFFRHIGIDPDEQRTPIEAIAVERLRAGGFRSRGLVEDALLIATLETGVPIEGFDAARVIEPIGIRTTRGDEALGDEGVSIPAGRLVIADAERPLALLFGVAARQPAIGGATSRALLAAIQVKGVPDVSVEEALWTAAEIISTPLER